MKIQVSSLKSQVSRLVLCLVVSFPLFFWGCRKELVNQPLSTPIEGTSNFKSLSVQEAKNWYMQHQFTKLSQLQGGTSNSFSSSSSNGNSVTSTNVIPIWAKAVNSLYYGQKPIVIAPFAEPSFFKYTRNQTAYLIIFRENDNTMNSRIMVFEADSTVQNQNPLDIQTFSGVTYQVNEHGNMGLVYKCLNGAIVAELKKDSSSLGIRDGCEGPGPGSCYGGWGDKNTNDFWDRLGRWFTGIWSGSNGSGSPLDYPYHTFRDPLRLNGGIDIPDPTGGPSGGGGLPLGNMLSQRNFNDVNVAQMITTCQNSDYEDMVTFGLRLSDPSMIANAPALVTFKGLGHQWADYFLNAVSHHYLNRSNNVDFSTALFTVVQNRNNNQNYFNGISFSLNTPVSRAAYGPLIGAYDRMMVDWSSTNGNCAAFSYTTAESFDNFKGLFADNLFQELNISAAGIDAERKQEAVSWLFMDAFQNTDCISAYFEACRLYPSSILTPDLFGGYYMKYKRTIPEITSTEFVHLFGNQRIFEQIDNYLARQWNSQESKDVVKEIKNEIKSELVGQNFAIDNAIAQDIQLHLNLLEQSSEYREVCNSLNALSGGSSGNNPMKQILLDLLLEGAQEWAENFLGINDLSALRDLLERATENSGKIAFKATRIIARFIAKKNPIFNALSSMWKAKEVYNKVDKAYKAFDKIKDIGEDVVTKIATVLKTRVGSVLKNIEWIGGNDGGKIKGVSALDMFDDLKRAYGGTARAGNANEIIFDIYTGGRQIECKLYVNSNTPRGEATISFKITGGASSGLTVKFGFDL